ncbi:MAG TPA: hypothetical protein VMB21_10120 [Candidatus Limnocylindria bacterium]|jgi:hypothetical protein|nr:hypothetical protein [Candidatus Limnocylindria bacterium]
MKPFRKNKALDAGRVPQAEPAEVRGPAIPADSNTVVYIGQTSGPNPTKYFLTFCFDKPNPGA